MRPYAESVTDKNGHTWRSGERDVDDWICEHCGTRFSYRRGFMVRGGRLWTKTRPECVPNTLRGET